MGQPNGLKHGEINKHPLVGSMSKERKYARLHVRKECSGSEVSEQNKKSKGELGQSLVRISKV